MITKYTSEAALDFHTDKDEVHHAQLANLAAIHTDKDAKYDPTICPEPLTSFAVGPPVPL